MIKELDSGCICCAGLTSKQEPAVLYAVSRSISSGQRIYIPKSASRIEIKPKSSDIKRDLGCHSIITASDGLLVCGNGEHVRRIYNHVRPHPDYIKGDMEEVLKSFKEEEDYFDTPRMAVMADNNIGTCTGTRYGDETFVHFSEYKEGKHTKETKGLFNMATRTYTHDSDADIINPQIGMDMAFWLVSSEPKDLADEFYEKTRVHDSSIIAAVAAVWKYDSTDGWKLAVRRKRIKRA